MKVNFILKGYCLLLLTVVGCQQTNSNASTSRISESRTQTQLILNNAILEQSNSEDNTVWKIQAKSSVYTEDKKVARLQAVTANFLQDGQVILRVSAEAAEVRNNGNLILLQDNIVAQDTRNGIVVKSDEIEWQPAKHLLSIRQNPKAIHSNLEVKATEGIYFTDTQSLELKNNIVATTIDPALQLKSDRLVWDISQETITSPLGLQIVRYQPDGNMIDSLVADQGIVNLSNSTATLSNNVELISYKPQLQMATNSLIWNYQTRQVNADRPLKIIDKQHNLEVIGNQAAADLNQKVVRLNDGVKGVNIQDRAQIYAEKLTWQIDTKTIEATGNVVYQQSDPQINLTGEKAVGKLAEDRLIVTGNQQKQVVSTIINEQS